MYNFRLFLVVISFVFMIVGCEVGSDDANNINNVNNINNMNNINNTNNTNNVNNTNNGDFTTLKSNEAREESPDVSSGDLADLVAGNSDFHFELYGEIISSESGNIIYSPWSISTALAMTWAGSAANTETEMASVLNFTQGQAAVHSGFNYLDLYLNNLGSGDPSAFILSNVNSIWGQVNYSFEQPFLDVLGVNYGAGLNLLDFATDPSSCRDTINGWVESKTNGRIDELLPLDSIDTLTRMVLVNTLYFKGKWASQFAPDATLSSTFHTLNDGDVTTEFMTMDASTLPYYEGVGYKAVELPYVGNDTSMLIIMPDSGTFDVFEAAFDRTSLNDVVNSLEIEPNLILTLPKFDFDFAINLRPILMAMGMEDAFTMGVADFTNMHQPSELYISNVVHKAFIGIDEAGTEAGAATAVIMSGFGLTVNLDIDSSFLFFIRDNETGTIIFAGRVVNPS